MTTTVTNSHGWMYRVGAVGGGDVAITSESGPTLCLCPPGEDLITAIQTELGLPESPPDVFKDLPDVGEPDSDGEYETPYSYISDAEEALENARFAYAVYLKWTSEVDQKVAKLAAAIEVSGLSYDPRELARRLIESGEVTVE